MNMSELKRGLCRRCKKGTKTLLAAVREGHKECVQIILADRERFPVSDATKALGYAVRYNRIEIARLALEEGANPSPKLDVETWETSPLHYATDKGNLEMVKLLLEFKADVDQLDLCTRMTPLSIATELGHTEIVRCLLESEADVNLERYAYDEAPLHVATRLGHLEITRLLLSRGADVDIHCPLYFACKGNHVEVVRVLLANTPKPDLYLGEQEQPLSIAIYHGYTEIVDLLLKAGVDINRECQDSCTPLEWAVKHNCEGAVPLILEYQPKLDRKCSSGIGVLHFINQKTKVATVKHLIRCGANPKDANKKGECAIWVAVRANNELVTKYLASVLIGQLNKVVGEGTVFHIACRYGSLNMVRILAEAGADVNFAAPGGGETPLQAACGREVDGSKLNDTLEVIRYLIHNGARVNDGGGNLRSPLHKACLSSAPEVIKLLLAEGADADCKDSVERTPAHLVCYRGLEHYHALSPSENALVARDSMGRTALHYAVISGVVELVEEVLEGHKQHPDYQDTYLGLVDKDGWTPLHWAARCVSPLTDHWIDMVPMIEYLVELGYDLAAKGKARDTEWMPVEVAIYHDADQDVKERLVPDDLEVNQLLPGTKFKGSFFCGGCFLPVVGIIMECQVCDNFWLCFKCQAYREFLHPAGHKLEQFSDEYDWGAKEWVPVERYSPCGSPILSLELPADAPLA
ncbi:hypothetical protein AtubIFM55763_004360 [Aspergillus tubingensis]|uniref:ankyrin repeat-containing domain protein n=1 Tax=Aspergillus tubingensis TaxID=5068 RepID=UPI0015780848|nr:ankyrin repeat-containing domain protein [Aspergillus tubingensis]GFN17203.1 ankyrin repeat-containing domain protein [Aspergillus tubingensis]GLA57927.1 hypothetical protein AtubIFM54640_005725 [Aspergillus tubingensis]GLA73442.1 hypothetical protein AtubIFM55763_004360 [Aspergillus tubingensis]GLA91684.1 hypothetical protein AtubIFM57143_005193 [Aspergillus tubingensis]GLB17734.1 hypothetical protein AtubIFM61612_007617 [Aspergillus tubingensis]